MKFLAVCVLTVSLVVVVHSSVLQPRGYFGGGGGGGYGGGFGMKMGGGGGAKGGTKGGPKGGLKGGKGEGGYGGGKEGGYGGEDKYGSDSEDSGVTVKELQITVKTLYSTYCKVTGKSDDVVAKMGSGFSYDKMKSAMAKYGYTCESDNEGKSSKGKKGKGGDSVQQLKDMCSYMYSKFCDATRQPKVKGFSMEAIKKAIAKYNSGSCGGGEGGDDKGYGSYGGKGGKGGKPGSYKPSGIGKYGDDDEGSNEDEEGGNGSYKSYGGKGGKSGGGYKGGKKPAGGYEGGDDEHEDEED